jgi:hypothetical protein
MRAFLAADGVRFANDDRRTIEQITVTPKWVSVALSGRVLDPDDAAYPKPFWLEDSEK